MAVAGLLGLLVSLIFGVQHDLEPGKAISENKVRQVLNKEGFWLEQLGFNVLSGAVDDQNILKTAFGMKDISLVNLSEQYYDNTVRLFAGKESVAKYATNTIGALSEFKGLASRLEEEAKS